MNPEKTAREVFDEQDIARILGMLDEHPGVIERYGETPETMPPSHRSMVPTPGVYLGFFGAALYWHGREPERYARIGREARDVMVRSINYDKLGEAIGTHTGMECRLFGMLNPPGLHIFGNETDKPVTINVANWHRDRFINGEFMDSWLIPIQLPAEPCGVDYMTDDGAIARFNYRAPGDLYHWPGELFHTISSMTLQPGERRITLQAHTIKAGDGRLILFW